MLNETNRKELIAERKISREVSFIIPGVEQLNQNNRELPHQIKCQATWENFCLNFFFAEKKIITGIIKAPAGELRQLIALLRDKVPGVFRIRH